MPKNLNIISMKGDPAKINASNFNYRGASASVINKAVQLLPIKSINL